MVIIFSNKVNKKVIVKIVTEKLQFCFSISTTTREITFPRVLLQS